MEKFSLTY